MCHRPNLNIRIRSSCLSTWHRQGQGRFAESYVADHRARSGAVKLAYELRQRGFAESVIEEVLEQERDSELERARQIWLKKFGTPPANDQEKARQLRFMLGRGFSPALFRRLFE